MAMHGPQGQPLARQLLVRWQENLIDLDIVVDDRRHDLDRAVAAFRAAVAQRDAVARQLADLIAAVA